MALEFAILTAARSGEVLGATWSEIDMVAKVWTIPATRMKSAREHRVPLSDPAVAVLNRLSSIRIGEFIFPGRSGGFSPSALRRALAQAGARDATVHGFRSSFRDWAADCTMFQREVVESALAHAVGNAVEQAYRRTDALEKRRGLMTALSKCTAAIDWIARSITFHVSFPATSRGVGPGSPGPAPYVSGQPQNPMGPVTSVRSVRSGDNSNDPIHLGGLFRLPSRSAR